MNNSQSKLFKVYVFQLGPDLNGLPSTLARQESSRIKRPAQTTPKFFTTFSLIRRYVTIYLVTLSTDEDE